jgi:hypothetical protein
LLRKSISPRWEEVKKISRPSSEGATPMTRHVEVMDLVAQLKAAEEAFVLATVVRTVSVTAA